MANLYDVMGPQAAARFEMSRATFIPQVSTLSQRPTMTFAFEPYTVSPISGTPLTTDFGMSVNAALPTGGVRDYWRRPPTAITTPLYLSPLQPIVWPAKQGGINVSDGQNTLSPFLTSGFVSGWANQTFPYVQLQVNRPEITGRALLRPALKYPNLSGS